MTFRWNVDTPRQLQFFSNPVMWLMTSDDKGFHYGGYTAPFVTANMFLAPTSLVTFDSLPNSDGFVGPGLLLLPVDIDLV